MDFVFSLSKIILSFIFVFLINNSKFLLSIAFENLEDKKFKTRLRATNNETVVIGTSGNDEIGVFHLWFDELLKSVFDESVVSCKNFFDVSSSVFNISGDSPSQCQVLITNYKYLQIHQIPYPLIVH